MTPRETATKLVGQPDEECTTGLSSEEIKDLARAFLAVQHEWHFKTEAQIRARIELLERVAEGFLARGGKADDETGRSFSWQINELRWVLGEMEETLVGGLLPRE